MTSYIQFSDEDGTEILVEVEQEEVNPPTGVVKAGLGQTIQKGLVRAKTNFDKAMEGVVKKNAQALMSAVQSLPTPPSEVELTFGIKATGEAGNFAIAKAGGEANYSIKMVWKSQSKDE